MNSPIIPDAEEVRDCLASCAKRVGIALGHGEPELIDESLGHESNKFTSTSIFIVPCYISIGKAMMQITLRYYSSDIRRIDMLFALYLDKPAKHNQRVIPVNLTWKANQVHSIATHRRTESGEVGLFNMYSGLELGHASYFFDPTKPSEGQLTDFRVVH